MRKNQIKKIIAIAFFILLSFLGQNFFSKSDKNNTKKVPFENKEDKTVERETVKVKFVIDGDTLVLHNGKKVRLLGIDTPERGEPFYIEAKERLKQLVEGKEITLEKDVSETDKYGRLLRHIYLNDNWINQQMIKEGWARLITIPPDVAHIKAFKKAQLRARENRRGIWQKDNQ